MRESTLTLPRELPLWELESWWTSKFSKNDCRGQNPMDWKLFYTIGKLLELKCLKWDRMIHLDIWNTSYGPNEGSGVKSPIWLPTTKSGESPRFPRVQVVCNILLESSWQGLQLCFRLHLNRKSAHKVTGPQSCESPRCGNFGTPTWESRDKMPFGCWSHGQA